jgi:hypothetical protein
VYVATQSDKFVLVIDGHESEPYDQFLFSPQAGSAFKTVRILATSVDPVFGRQFVRLEVESH